MRSYRFYEKNIFIKTPHANLKPAVWGPFFISNPYMLWVAFFLFLSFGPLNRLSAQNIIEPVPILMQEVAVPKSFILCGEPMPLQNRAVWEMLDRELNISVWDHAQVFMWLKRSTRYFPYIEKKLAEANMPDDLKYVAIAESALQTNIMSNAGALGPWQFLAQTGRSQGLRKDNLVDDRLSYIHSTNAALKYLQYLKNRFGTWSLAMAAYNCGETALQKELNEQKLKDFYRLNLPIETERYVFRVAAAKMILESPERYGYKLPPPNRYPLLETESISIQLKFPLHITEFAQAIGTDFKVIKELNPQFIGYYFPQGDYTINVPLGCAAKVSEYLKKELPRPVSAEPILTENDEFYVVQPGDTLIHISRRTGIPVQTLLELNDLEDPLIKVGQKLRLKP
ncbi:MAG: LysM peptidoglycan-binding domain-containing protein [Desulfobacteraceae bacterium]|nr:MAG: LysM peptidoglycan-binding domain-containing protein [Desulfobacteraceae bacterium]